MAVIDLSQAFYLDPPELDFIWPGFVAGTVGALIAPGATGKSFWALQAAMSVAAADVQGSDLLGLSPTQAGRVVYLAGEDPEPVLQQRVHAIGQHFSSKVRDTVIQRLELHSIMGSGFNVMNPRQQNWLVEYCKDTRLIIFDTLSRIHALDENSNGDMARLISGLERIAANTGAAVLYLHHTSKGSAREGFGTEQQAARGASALVDNARWGGFVTKMTEEERKKMTENGACPISTERRSYFVRWGVSKQNYCQPIEDKWFERRKGGVLIPAELHELGAVKTVVKKEKVYADDDF